jgi:hypothetical protein
MVCKIFFTRPREQSTECKALEVSVCQYWSLVMVRAYIGCLLFGSCTDKWMITLRCFSFASRPLTAVANRMLEVAGSNVVDAKSRRLLIMGFVLPSVLYADVIIRRYRSIFPLNYEVLEPRRHVLQPLDLENRF